MLHLVDIATVAKCLGVNVRHDRPLLRRNAHRAATLGGGDAGTAITAVAAAVLCADLLRFDLEVIARWVDQNRHGEERIGTSQPRRMN